MKQYLNQVAMSLILVSALFLSACGHTVQGVGQDMQKNGKAVENSGK